MVTIETEIINPPIKVLPCCNILYTGICCSNKSILVDKYGKTLTKCPVSWVKLSHKICEKAPITIEISTTIQFFLKYILKSKLENLENRDFRNKGRLT